MMLKKLTILFALLIVGLTAQSSFAQTDKEKNTALIVKITKFLEEKPFDAQAKSYRENAFKYLVETKDVSVVVCGGDLMKEITKKKNKYGGELLIQQSLGMAVFKLTNPANADENAAQFAGYESMFRAYEQMVKEQPDAKFAGMDDLIAKRDGGTLKTQIAADCSKKKSK